MQSIRALENSLLYDYLDAPEIPTPKKIHEGRDSRGRFIPNELQRQLTSDILAGVDK